MDADEQHLISQSHIWPPFIAYLNKEYLLSDNHYILLSITFSYLAGDAELRFAMAISGKMHIP